jgi:tetratricopeptide (TPR) repeat protein
MNLKGDEISNEDIETIYPIFFQIKNYESLISLLKISIKRDKTNIEHLEVLRNAYIKIKDYENAEKIYQLILELQ